MNGVAWPNMASIALDVDLQCDSTIEGTKRLYGRMCVTSCYGSRSIGCVVMKGNYLFDPFVQYKTVDFKKLNAQPRPLVEAITESGPTLLAMVVTS